MNTNSRSRRYVRRLFASTLAVASISALAFHPAQAQPKLNPELMPVFRIRVVLTTGKKKHSDTNDRVYMRVGKSKSNSMKVYLNKGGNDREKGDRNYYSVFANPARILTVRDIRYFALQKKGKNAWCVRGIRIHLNGADYAMYRSSWSKCKWLDGKKQRFSLNAAELRADKSRWTAANTNIPAFIRNKEIRISHKAMRGTLETHAGHLITGSSNKHMKRLYWGGKKGKRFVYAKRKKNGSVEVDFDMKYKIKFAGDPEIDFDFRYRPSCKSGRLSFRVERPHFAIKHPRKNYLIAGLVGSIFGPLGTILGVAGLKYSESLVSRLGTDSLQWAARGLNRVIDRVARLSPLSTCRSVTVTKKETIIKL